MLRSLLVEGSPENTDPQSMDPLRPRSAGCLTDPLCGPLQNNTQITTKDLTFWLPGWVIRVGEISTSCSRNINHILPLPLLWTRVLTSMCVHLCFLSWVRIILTWVHELSPVFMKQNTTPLSSDQNGGRNLVIFGLFRSTPVHS